MTFEEFKNYAIFDDEHNSFSVETEIPDFIPFHLIEFYKNYNPLDVDISWEGVSIHLYSCNELNELQSSYTVQNAFVFATCNGDPIFLSDGLIYTCPHGVENSIWELITFDKLDCFLPKT